VFYAERFILEFSVEFVCETDLVFDTAELDVHSIYDPMNLAVFVANLLISYAFEAVAEREEVFYCLWTNI